MKNEIKSNVSILIERLDTSLSINFINGSKIKIGIDWSSIHAEQDVLFMKSVNEKCKQK